MGLRWCSVATLDDEITSINNTRNTQKFTGDFSLPAYSVCYDEPSSMQLIKTTDCRLNKKCHHYQNAKNGIASLETLQHLQSKLHTADQCDKGSNCKKYQRLVNEGYKLDDLVHLQLYFHPGRMNHGSNNDCTELKLVKAEVENAGLHNYNNCDKSYKKDKDGLRKEIIRNGYRHVLTISDGEYQNISEIVEEKLKHPIHIQYGSPLNYDEMLSIILYTSTNIGKDLRDTEMKQNYHKWKYLRNNIANAIYKLPSLRKNTFDGSGKLYHGLSKVSSAKKYDGWCQGLTIWSTTIDCDIALQFAENDACLLEFPISPGLMFENADVSWISKFPDEKEVILLPNCGCIITHVDTDELDLDRKVEIYRVATTEE